MAFYQARRAGLSVSARRSAADKISAAKQAGGGYPESEAGLLRLFRQLSDRKKYKVIGNIERMSDEEQKNYAR